MTHPSKQKGNRRENEVVRLHEHTNAFAKRIPLSGAVQGYPGDVEIRIPPISRGSLDSEGAITFRGEVKARASGSGFKTLEGWMGDNDFLFLKRDRQPFLVVLTEEAYKKLLGPNNENNTASE
jgi:hypothetical protein